ncbi:two-component system sensor histidine kinase UhpB [Actimicrobium sp. GrIS 1.19]|uniref:PAS domain-containing sensor histidine kinase n=1 Tax=Actimicrobium sp. GrIS 1.19 TaxID=3071708 RepID=UPI002E063203|nr:two-component system sensor histidine kinase UhpB [Actimicrobium sp. GrIS 1.19]
MADRDMPRAVQTPDMHVLEPAWLPLILDSAFDEISVLDLSGLRFLTVNPAARDNLQLNVAELHKYHFHDVAPALGRDALHHLLKPLQAGKVRQVVLATELRRHDGSHYPCELRFVLAMQLTTPVLIVIGKDTSARHESAAALGLIEARFRAIVSNTPGLVYQFRLLQNGDIAFPYLSDACHALLGITPEQLHNDPDLFLELILAEDRASYLESMAASAGESTSWNWAGRIWIEEWKDIKWINLRATPRALAGSGVQWEGIMTNITQSKHEEVEIKRSRAQLAELSAHIETVKEEERTRIAREIHDDLGGNLTAIKMALALLKRRMPDDAGLIEKADYVDALVDRTIEAIHRISVDLRPSILDFGIVAAIDWQAREFEKQLGIPCVVVSNKQDIALPPDQATALFRIFQESLTNIGKHASASRVDVRLTRSNRGIRLEISDNGRGIAARDRLKPKSFGIRGMVERANALGGSLSVSNVAGGGSMVAIRIPLPAASTNHSRPTP